MAHKTISRARNLWQQPDNIQ